MRAVIRSGKTLDRIGNLWSVRIAFGAAYTLFYAAFAPSVFYFALLPFHFVMGPIHGAIVNWCGHKYGYRNFDTHDLSRNTLPFDFLTLGELFQNNHHKAGMAPNFAVRWFEIDPAYLVIRTLAAMGIVQFAGDNREPEASERGLRGFHRTGPLTGRVLQPRKPRLLGRTARLGRARSSPQGSILRLHSLPFVVHTSRSHRLNRRGSARRRGHGNDGVLARLLVL